MNASDSAENDPIESSQVLPTRSRSTFEPPIGFHASGENPVADPSAEKIDEASVQDVADTDDDALAAALAEELGRVTRTGAIPLQPAPQPETGAETESGSDSETEAALEPDVDLELPGESPSVIPEPPVWSIDDVPLAQEWPAAAPEPVEIPPPAVSPEPFEAPPPDLPAERGPSLTPPVRQSLPDQALVQWIGDGETLEAMEQLERELSLRQQDAAAFAAWEQSMRALGTPEALSALDGARAGFADVLGSDTGTIMTPPVAPLPDSARAAQPAPTATSDNEPDESSPSASDPVFEFDDAGTLNAEQLADLAQAPAPQSMPYSDIPPPPGESGTEVVTGPDHQEGPYLQAGAEFEAGPELVTGAGIPDLIEPADVEALDAAAMPVASEFDAFLAEAERAASSPEAATAASTDGDAALVEEGDAEAFPLPVYDPGEVVPETVDLVAPRAFRIELAGLEPAPLEHRVGRSARLFWIWFAANSSVISVGLGAVILSLGVSLRQAVIATLIGVSISSLPLGIGALAGKRSGQPTMVVSRASFGLVGNILPALLAFVTRVFWGAVLLWLLALGVSTVNASTGALAIDTSILTLGALGVAVLLAGVIACFGYGLIARVQAVLTIVSSVLVVGFIMLSWPAVDLRAAMRVADGDWMLVATGAVLVFSVIGLAWAMSSADVARYQYPHSSGAGSMLWSWAGAALPAFLLVGYGSLLAASDPELLTGLLERPIETITLLAPPMFVYPMLAVLGLGLLSGAIMTMYSGGFALQSLGLRAPRSIVAIVVAVLTGAAAVGILLAVSGFEALLVDLATTIAVPVAAWVGVFSAELMVRSRRFHSESLVSRGGAYPDVRWVNLITLIVATGVGYGFTTASVSWLSWQGFGWQLLGMAPDSALASTDVGVIGALVLALAATVIAGRAGIRAQESYDPEGVPAVDDEASAVVAAAELD